VRLKQQFPAVAIAAEPCCAVVSAIAEALWVSGNQEGMEVKITPATAGHMIVYMLS
jgi:hypothetical protein